MPGAFSIKAKLAATNNGAVQANTIQNTALASDNTTNVEPPINPEALKAAWQQFTVQYNNDKVMLCRAMRENMPEISEQYTIEVKVSNNILQQRFTDENESLTTYLRNVLKNSKVRINVEVVATDDDEPQEMLTPQARLKRMYELNPALRKLSDDLNLELIR